MISLIPIIIFWNICNIYELIVFGIPWSIISSFGNYFMYNINFMQIIYFHIICFYLKLKLQNINNEIQLRNKRKINITELFRIIKKLNLIYSEINNYNLNFWNHFLFWFYSLYITIIGFFIFSILFAKMNFVLRLIFIIATQMNISIMVFVILSASNIVKESNRSYNLLNSYSIRFGKIANSRKLKVFSNVFFIYNY